MVELSRGGDAALCPSSYRHLLETLASLSYPLEGLSDEVMAGSISKGEASRSHEQDFPCLQDAERMARSVLRAGGGAMREGDVLLAAQLVSRLLGWQKVRTVHLAMYVVAYRLPSLPLLPLLSPLQSSLSQSMLDGLLHLFLTHVHLQGATPTTSPPDELLYGCSALIQAGGNLGPDHVSWP